VHTTAVVLQVDSLTDLNARWWKIWKLAEPPNGLWRFGIASIDCSSYRDGNEFSLHHPHTAIANENEAQSSDMLRQLSGLDGGDNRIADLD
jgi:hypothetical protein